MTDDILEDDNVSKKELRAELRYTRARLRELESELTETNEGMVALTLELENAKERYLTIFEESTDAILLIDPDRDTIHEANPRACDLLGYDHDVLGTLTPEEIFPDECEKFHSFAEAVVHGWADEFTCRTKSGRQIDLDISASMVTLGGQSFLLASLRDVTERKRREQRLQVLTRVFRHNLRNDGNVIQGYADLLYEELSESTLEENAFQIKETVDRILKLSSKVRRIQDILDRNQIEPMSIDDVLIRHQEWFVDAFPTSALSVSVPDREVTVGRRLGVAIKEAIENAAIHTDSAVRISIGVSVDDDTDRVKVSVDDDGPGIPAAEIQAVDTGSETPLTHGSGIGLWVIHWVVDSLGGEVTVQRSDPTGTILEMSVPMETEPGNPVIEK